MASALENFPWENGIQPYWINPENGVEWYVDKDTTEWCSREFYFPHLPAICFIVAVREGETVRAIERVLIDKETNTVLAAESSLDGMCTKIDMIRFSRCG